ncbi:MAG TPA: HD domain-containing protein [Mycobacteriales bacterium]|nr:HD domain-containing protein [Mycobacteriales bacterium]
MVLVAADLEEIVDLLEVGASDLDAGGENGGFSLLDHGLQCARLARVRHPDDLELQVAALVHDIGQTLTDNDEAAHGRVGGEFVAPVLGPRVAALVELHVPAKRYLVTTDADYSSRLSPASVASLELQGGRMTDEEVAEFERRPWSSDAVVLRRYDESAKVAGEMVDPLEAWLPTLREVAERVSSRATVRGAAHERS